MDIKILVVTKYKWPTREFLHARIKKLIESGGHLRVVAIDTIYRDLGDPPMLTRDDDRTVIDPDWFEEVISVDAKAKGYTHAVFQFSNDDGKRWGVGTGHRGLNYRDGDYFGECWIKCDEHSLRSYHDEPKFRNTYSVTFPHEIGHELTRQGVTDKEMHDFDFQDTINRIEAFYGDIEPKNVKKIIEGRVKNLMSIVIDRATRLLNIKKNMTVAYPVPKETFFGKITQGFGVRNVRYRSGIHNGSDIAIPIGTPLRAACDGFEVYQVFRGHPSMGNACYVRFTWRGMKYWQRYLHLSEVPKVGTYAKSQTFAVSGNTGESTGPHFHFDMWRTTIDSRKLYTKSSVLANLLDPVEWYRENGE